jgi:hypothetical protein
MNINFIAFNFYSKNHVTNKKKIYFCQKRKYMNKEMEHCLKEIHFSLKFKLLTFL